MFEVSWKCLLLSGRRGGRLSVRSQFMTLLLPDDANMARRSCALYVTKLLLRLAMKQRATRRYFVRGNVRDGWHCAGLTRPAFNMSLSESIPYLCSYIVLVLDNIKKSVL